MSQDSNGILFLQRMKNKLKIAMTYHIHVRLVFRSYVHNNYMEKSYFRLKKMIVAVSNVPPVIKRICVQTKHKFHTEFWINIDYKHWKLRPNICTCNVCFRAWASAEIFPGGGGKVDILIIFFSGCWRCNANGRIQKENVHCYSNSCIQCFPCKKTFHWANVLVSMDSLRLS